MKKLYAFFAAALMSASLFAAAPTPADLAAEYDVVNNVVFCIQFIEDAELCNDVRFVGTPNGWGKGLDAPEGAVESWDNCEKFAPVPGFDGWYAAELPYSEGFEGKPLQEPTDRHWTWDYQCGDMDAWVHVDGLELELSAGYEGECNIKAGAAGAYIYQLKYWKLHKTPCQAVVKHNYTVKCYAPNACAEMKPAIIGDFNGWKEGVAMAEGLDDDFNTVYTYTFEDEEGHGFKIKEVTDTDWTNEIQAYDAENDTWANLKNFTLGAEELIVLDYSDNTKYRFAKCSNEETLEIQVQVKLPAEGTPEAGVEIIGTFDAWAGTAMNYHEGYGIYWANISAKASDTFKFRGAGSWDIELQLSEDNGETWENCPNLNIKDFVFEQEGHNYISINFTNLEGILARWTPGDQGIENVVLTEKAQKVMVDGVIYIIRDNKMFNLQGAQVR